MTFRVGQKVVCVDSFTFDEKITYITIIWKNKIVVGNIYTVRALRLNMYKLGNEWIDYVLLHEILNELYDFGSPFGLMEPGWPHIYFRPLQERETDISVFTRMLNTDKVKA